MKSSKLLTVFFVLLAYLCCPAFSNTKMLYSETLGGIRVKSESGKFIVVFRLPLDMNDRVLEVFDVNDEQRNLIWKIPPFQKYIPHDMFVSDDGKYVVILDDSRKPAGNALEFYSNDKGRIKAYSQQDILSLSETVEGRRDKKAFSTSYSFFHTFGQSTYFCSLVWTEKDFYWLVWNAANGDHIKTNQKLIDGIFNQAREHFGKQILIPGNYSKKIIACFFLSKLRRLEDRYLVEKLLHEEWFVTNPSITYKESLWSEYLNGLGFSVPDKAELEFFYAQSPIRQFADIALSQWDSKTDAPLRLRRDDYTYYYLGKVSVQVILTAQPKKHQCLWIYLLPESLDKDQWDNKRPVHYLYADFDGFNINYKIGRTVPCVIMGVTPGRYWLKAVWDRNKPFYNEDDEYYKPQNGDYESIDNPVIQVKAAQTIDVGTLNCNHKVKTR